MSKVVKRIEWDSVVLSLLRTACSAALALLASACIAHAQNVTLAWDRNSETNLSNYTLKYGTSSGSYTAQISVATNLTTATASNLTAGRTYYFVVTARNVAGLESSPSSEVSYLVPRTGTNAVPLANAASVTTAEDAPRVITLTGSDADGDPLTFAVVNGPANGALSGTAPNLTYTPAANYNGSDSFTFRVNDGLTNSAVATVSITVTAVNDAPTLNALANVTVTTNGTPQNVSLSGIGSGAANENQTLSVTATSSNPSLVPNPTVSYSSPNATGSLTLNPAAGQNGSATITVTVNDGAAQNNSVSRTFSVTVGTPPTLTLFIEAESGTLTSPMQSFADANASNGQAVHTSTAEDGAAAFTFNITQAGTYRVWCHSLCVDAGSDSFYVSMDGGTQDVYDPAQNAASPNWQWSTLKGRVVGDPWLFTLSAGNHTLTFWGREADTGLDSFYISNDPNFTPGGTPNPNQPPTLNAITGLTLSEDAPQQTVSLTGISDGSASENQTVTVTASSSNTGLIPNPAVSYTNPNTTGSLTFTPVPNANGSATITVTANDGQSANNTVSRTFTVTVNAVNDAPTFAPINNVSITEDAGAQTVTVTGINSGAANENQTLTLTASSSNPSLIPNPTVNYTSPNATASLAFTPVANANGTATITVTVNDGQSANNTFTRTFTVTVGGVNDSPTLNAIANVTVNEDAAPQTVSLSGISAGVNETQPLTVSATSSNPSLIPNPSVTYTSPNATGSLSFTPAANASGSASVTVTVNDGQSANNTFSRNFTITVNTVNDPPTFDPLANVSVNEDSGARTVTVTGINSGAANESQTLTLTASSSNAGLIPNPSVSYSSPNATGSLTFTPVANASGTATITVTVNDGQSANNTFSRTFTVSVGGINDAPGLNAIASITVNEDSGPQTVSLSGITAGVNETQPLTVTATSSDPSLLPNPTVTYTSPNATGSLNFTPVANANGSATITVTVNDGQSANNTFSRTFTVTVNPVNDPPTMAPIANVSIAESAGTQTVNVTGIGAGAVNEAQSITLSASSSNPALIPTPTVSYSSPNTTATLTFTPVAAATGSATITVTADDGQGANHTFNRTFTVTVTAVNDPPTLDSLSSLDITEDTPAQTVTLTGISSGAANETQTLTVSATSSAPSIIPNPSVSYVSPNSTGTLTFKPATNATGTATITVTVNDGQAQNNTVSRTFQVNVAGVNDAPTLTHIANQTIAQGTSTPALGFTVSDVETPAANLTVSGSSANQALVPNANISLGGSGASRTVTVTPASGQSGSVLITLQVSDGNGGVASDSFTLNVTAVNQPPTLNPLANLTVPEDDGMQTVTLTGITSGSVNESQTLVITATSSNPSLIPNPTVTYSSPNIAGLLTFTSSANNSGSATITVTVNDGQSQNNTVTRSFTVTVEAQNDPPTLTSIPDQTIAQSTSTALLPFTVADVETAATSLTMGASASNPTLVPASGMTFAGSGANRTLKVTPAANQFGQAVITVSVSDGTGGLANSSFLLTVTTVNLPPTLDPASDLVLAEDAVAQTVSLTGISSGSLNENQTLTLSAVSSDPSLIPNPTVSYTSPNTGGFLHLAPVANANGSAVITVTVNDGQSQNNVVSRSFTVTVNSVNDAPTLNPLANVALPAQTALHSVALSGISSGAANEEQTLTVTAVSSNPSLIPNPTVNYFSPNTTGTLNLSPAANASGTATITVTVDDGQAQNNSVVRVFTVTVSGANEPPSITDLPDITISLNGTASPLNFVVGDSETSADRLLVVATSSNPALVWTNNIVLSGSGSNRVASIKATVGQSGSSVITFTVSDTDGSSASDSFVLTVMPLNAAPTLDPLPNLTLAEDSGPQTITLTGISPGTATENQTVIITAVSSTPGVIPHPTVTYQSPNQTGTLVFQPVPNVSGSATITITLNDGQAQNNVLTRSFGVIVNPQNDVPTVSSIPNQLITENTSTPVLPFIVNDTETPAFSLGVSAASSDTTLLPGAGIILGGSGANRTIQVTPAPNRSGTATVTIYVNDGLLTAATTFNVTVGTANTPPTITIDPPVGPALSEGLVEAASVESVTVAASDPTFITDSYHPITNVLVHVGDRESRADDLILSAISYNQTVIPTTNIIFSGSGSNRTLAFKPVQGKSGLVTVSIGVSDGSAISRALCSINVSLGTAPKAKLNVKRKGNGSVQPALDGMDLTIGASYTLTAVPAPEEVFVGWSGSITSSSPTVTFVMTTNLVLICGFTNSPYFGLRGSFNGLFHEAAEVRQGSSGNFVLTTSDQGALSGKLKLGATTYSFAGKIPLSCRATNLIVRKTGTPLRVELDFSHTNQVVGRVTDGTWEAPLMGDRAVFNSKTRPAPYAGSYTLILPGQATPDLGPEGDGFATLKIDANGLATVAGTLADGTKMALKVPVASGGQWPFYVPLYSGTGSVLSWLQVSNRLGDDVNGLMSWIKGSSTKAKYYAGGFTNECIALGSRFIAPVPHGNALALNQATIHFLGGDLLNPFSNLLGLESGLVKNLGVNKLALKINPASGLITGTVTEPATQKPLKFTGAVFQKQNAGSGFLLGPSLSARFVIAE